MIRMFKNIRVLDAPQSYQMLFWSILGHWGAMYYINLILLIYLRPINLSGALRYAKRKD
jgi:hypothetical protein